MDSPKYSADGRWEIRWVCTKDFNSYFESDCRYEARVIDRATKKCFIDFIRDEFANAGGSENTGVSSVEFLLEGEMVRATYEDGRVEDVLLPAKD